MADLDLRDKATGVPAPAKGVNGALPVYGLARNFELITAAATTTESFGFIVVAVPTAGDTSLTPVDGAAVGSIPAATFVAGNVYPIHTIGATVGTGGTFMFFIA